MTLIMKSGTKLQKINKRNAKCARGKGAREGGREGGGGVRVRRGVRGLNTRPPPLPPSNGNGSGERGMECVWWDYKLHPTCQSVCLIRRYFST